jgi:SpoVK/Ycf46/Vps4 family AAA+-type ATPase
LETHRGIVILASNFPQNIDDAFARRIDIAVEFTLPDAAARMRLWRQLTPIEAKADIDCELLGRQFTLSGGAIRNCIVTAAFLAAQEGITIGTVHCVRAVAQEYEKSGKALTRMEFGDTFRQLRPRAER